MVRPWRPCERAEAFGDEALQRTTQYYEVLQSFYTILQSTTKYYEGLRTTYLGYRKWKFDSIYFNEW